MRALPWCLPLLAACSSGGSDPDLTPTPTPLPVLDPQLYAPTSWDNATVYFVMTDRFVDGDPGNNNAYGRMGDGEDEIGTFHGGDLLGLLEKLNDDYFSRLGVSVLWITAPYEQVHGWVPGGQGDFQHYPYHGYYALDFTRMDEGIGTPEVLHDLVEAAHAKGIRVILDVVMNHPGYAAITDLAEFGVDVLKPGWEDATLANYYDLIDFQSAEFANWWGVDWIRAGLGGGYETGGPDDLTKGVAYLPDFKTEAVDVPVGLPPFYAQKPDTGAVLMEGASVRDYLITWLTDWVEIYGVDGFRCDTVKHVEMEAWAELKLSANDALVAWRAANPGVRLPDELYPDPNRPFWMVGEVFPHGLQKDAYFDNGFDALINFDYVAAAAAALENPSAIDSLWSTYAATLNTDPEFNVLSYISSHDTALFFSKYAGSNLAHQQRAGELLLLAPGAVQIFYGDENARPPGPASSDPQQPTRSDYVWGANPDVLKHWRKLGQFRHLHEAVGAGDHTLISLEPYTFRRTKDDDVVYVVLGATEDLELDVSADFEEGTQVCEYFFGLRQTVSGGKIQLDAVGGAPLLVEKCRT